MKIHILFEFKSGPWGGGNQFLKALRNELRRRSFYVDRPEEADVVIFNSFPFGELYRLRQAFELKKQGKVLVHRVDGPIFRARQRDLEVDKAIYLFNKVIADGAIFQSDWSRQENHRLGMEMNRYETVVWNAPESTLFNTRKRKSFDPRNKIRIIAASWSTSLRKGFDVYRFLDRSLDWDRYEMVFVGNSPTRFRNIEMLGVLDSKQFAKELKQSDIFISASLTEACSNSLIEAMHCGCVLVARDNTSHPEIVGESGILFRGIGDVLGAVERATKNYQDLQSRIFLPSLEEVSGQYYAFGKKIWQDVQEGKYELKQGNRVDRCRILRMAYGWSLKNKLRKSLLN